MPEVAGQDFIFDSVEAGEVLSVDANSRDLNAAFLAVFVPEDLDDEEGVNG